MPVICSRCEEKSAIQSLCALCKADSEYAMYQKGISAEKIVAASGGAQESERQEAIFRLFTSNTGSTAKMVHKKFA